ncbi:MAG: alpha/beta hydrolase [candidate division Zixibacteria bacterium]|nr:alpha/beta hydrolase [candidate division Zixibacteria bacterium]
MTVRKYGQPPFSVAVLHGGPGAPGYMAPVARELAMSMGVLEPLQSKDSLDGQIEELRLQLRDNAATPAVLVGSSWGAVLALFLAARRSELVGKLVLIGCAVFDKRSSARVEATRQERLDPKARRENESIRKRLETAGPADAQRLMDAWGAILFDADVFDPITRDLEVIETQFELHRRVWQDFVCLRDNPGFLEREFSKIRVPTLVIHGEYDPHSMEGIRPLLTHCLPQVRFQILPQCGHYPWIERMAKDRFYAILREELREAIVPPDPLDCRAHDV